MLSLLPSSRLEEPAAHAGLTTLMVCAIALGIAACIVTLTVYHAMSGNPIWWKSNVLYAVTMDSWDRVAARRPERPTLPPPQLTYQRRDVLLPRTSRSARPSWLRFSEC